MHDQNKDEFHEAMVNIYRRAKSEVGYNAKLFLRMVNNRGGLEAAKGLIVSPTISDGYIALWERKRLDLTMEAMILGTSKFHCLFTPDELEICRKRLKDYRYDFGDESD